MKGWGDGKNTLKKPPIWLECGPFNLQEHYHSHQRSKSVTGGKKSIKLREGERLKG